MRKQFLFTVMLCLMAMTMSAQIHITPEIGITMLKKDYAKATVSPRIGVGVDFLFKEDHGLGINTGLFFYQKKMAWKEGTAIMNNGDCFPLFSPHASFITDADVKKFIFEDSDEKRNYLHLPLLITYTWKIADNCGLSVGVGPYIAYGFSGNYALSKKEYDVEKEEFSFSEEEYNPFDLHSYDRCDVGISSMASLNISRLMIKISYETNLNQRDIREDNLISLGVGYKFSL